MASKKTVGGKGMGASNENGSSKRSNDRPKLRSSHSRRADDAPKAGFRGGESRGPGGAKKKAAKGAPAGARSGGKVFGKLVTPKLSPAKAGGPSKAGVKATPKKAKGTVRDTPVSSMASDSARKVAITIATAALEKKAVGLEILDVAGRVDYADFLVIMTGRSDRQVAALAQGIEEGLRKIGKRPLSTEGLPLARWVLMDFGDVVVHIFQDDARSLYDIDGLWMDAKRLPVPDSSTLN
ncbi:MAG: ribosome silencing factor [Polyangiaceae bacterium]